MPYKKSNNHYVGEQQYYKVENMLTAMTGKFNAQYTKTVHNMNDLDLNHLKKFKLDCRQYFLVTIEE